MVLVLLVEIMKDGMERNVLVLLVIIKLMEFVSLVLLILSILVKIVPAILDSMVMEETNVINVTVHVENVQDLQKINAQCVQMSAILSLRKVIVVFVLEIHHAQLVSITKEENASPAHHIVHHVSQNQFVRLVLVGSNLMRWSMKALSIHTVWRYVVMVKDSS
jgi:hypothetical protein